MSDVQSQASTDDKVSLMKRMFPRRKGKRTLTEEDWNRRQEQWRKREQEMIDRMLKFVVMEPEELSLSGEVTACPSKLQAVSINIIDLTSK